MGNVTRKDHTTVLVSRIPNCSICWQERNKSVPAKVDGKTKWGPWAYMCGNCFKKFGIGLGLGAGQELVLREGAK